MVLGDFERGFVDFALGAIEIDLGLVTVVDFLLRVFQGLTGFGGGSTRRSTCPVVRIENAVALDSMLHR